MTPIEQQRRDAFDDLDGLLSEGMHLDEAITEAAVGNGLKPDVLRALVERHFGGLEAYQERIALRAGAAARENEDRQLERKVCEEAAIAAEHNYYACELNDPALAGRPSWPHAFAGWVERRKITDGRLREAAWEAYIEAVKRLDRKYGTHTSHYHY